jgi:hypothetical protein
MPVRKFKSVEEMEAPWREPGDPALYRAIARVWDFGRRSGRRRFPPGLYRRRSLEELNSATERWSDDNFQDFASRQAAARRPR